MKLYYIHDGLKECGPFSVEQLSQQNISNKTPVWFEGLETWSTIGDEAELKNQLNLGAVPPPFQKLTETISPPKYANGTPETVKPPAQITKNSSTNGNGFAFKVLGIIAVLVIIIWLFDRNEAQADVIASVEQKVNEQASNEQLKQEEKDRVNALLTEKYMGYRNNWSAYISAGTNSYSYNSLGGISNLAVEVYNQTDRKIEEVQVLVQYLKANGGLYKTESVSVTNIGPNAKKQVYAPDSERGTSVNVEIQGISAPSFHFCYPYGMPGNRNIDPYFCK